MISKSKKIVTIGLCACLLFGCKESNAESKMESGISTFHADQKILEEHSESKVNVEEQCKALSEQSEYEYKPLTGYVYMIVDNIGGSVTDVHYYMGRTSEKPEDRHGDFIAVLEEKTYRSFSESGPFSLEKGKKYSFCGRRKIKNKEAYVIDHLEAIQEIK